MAISPGWLQKLEVVEVTFDPAIVSFEKLIEKAEGCDCAQAVFTRTDEQQALAEKKIGEKAKRTDEKVRVTDDKYYLSRTPGKHLPLTPLQAARVNVRVGAKASYEDLLSPKQRALLDDIGKHPQAGWKSAIGVDFRAAWEAAETVRAGLGGEK